MRSFLSALNMKISAVKPCDPCAVEKGCDHKKGGHAEAHKPGVSIDQLFRIKEGKHGQIPDPAVVRIAVSKHLQDEKADGHSYTDSQAVL